MLLCVSLAACDSTTAQEHTANAQERLSEGEIRTAVIELKNALQKDPDLADARALLGEAHLRLGDYPSALKELERALDLGLDNDRVRVALLRTKVRLGNYQEVIGALEDSGALEPRFAVILADAYLQAGDAGKAEALYRQGESLSEGNLGLGLIAWQEGDLEQANRYLTEAVRLDRSNWEAWLRKGEYELSRGAYDEADAAFTEAVGLPAADVLGRVGLARVDLSRGDLEAAAAEVQELLRRAPGFAVAHYLDGLVRFQQQDLDGAEAAIREVQRTAPDHPPSLYLMGAIKYRQGQFAQAESSLQRYLAEDPGNESAAKLLASTRFDQENFQGTVDALQPFVAGTDDPQLLAMHGAAHLRLGNPAEAARSLERSVELAPDMAPFRNQLALSLLAAGDRSGAEAELESAIEVDGEQFESDYLLAMLRMRDGEWEAASEAVESLVRKHPDSPIGHNLRGAVALGIEDREAARAAFRRALEIDPAFLPAVQNLARLELADDNPEQAVALFETFLEANAGHEGALLALAELALRGGDRETATSYLEQAVDANPGAVRPSLGLARLYLASGRAEDAGRVIREALQLAPGTPDLLLHLAEVHLRSGDTTAAVRVAKQLQSRVAAGSDNVALLLAVGRLQARVGEIALARGNLERVLAKTDGGEAAALQALARLDLRERKLDQARARLQQLQNIAADDRETQLLDADLAMADGRRADAEKIYTSLAEAGVRDGVLRLAALSLAEGDASAALEHLEGWIEEYPGDLGAQLLSADALMRHDQEQAVTRYETLLGTGNPVVLNNLAWLYMEKGDPRAVAVARRAVEAAPDNPDILDTLGWVLLKQGGDRAEAVRVLRRSVQLNPGNPSVHYHLGIALRDTGDVAGARDALGRALENEGFPEADEARAALAAL
jgi:putative PEP-CTERM system TPR-repeat lipoprotein